MFGYMNTSGLSGVPQEGGPVGAAGWMGPSAHPTARGSTEQGIPPVVKASATLTSCRRMK